MSQYALDGGRQEIVVVWGTGVGNVASMVAPVPAGVAEAAALHLVEALTFLAHAAWRTYTHPASAQPGLDPSTEGWRREGDRAAFPAVLSAIERPNLPEGGVLVQSYIVVEEAAHRVGRALNAIADAGLARSVTADVRAELDAIERAERGELSGRARQAVTLTRADASPAQVAAADTLLREDPLGSTRLFTDVDPTAAAVAAAHWLHAAAAAVAARSEVDVCDVVVEADNIEALPHETPTIVLERLDAGGTPRDVVMDLVADAMAVAEGEIPDLDALLADVVDADARVDALDEQDAELREALMPHRLTPLDPQRPAVDLLEDLLSGLRGCWLLYREYADMPPAEPPDEHAASPMPGHAANSDGHTGTGTQADTDTDTDTGWHDLVIAAFRDEVRAAADSLRGRLL